VINIFHEQAVFHRRRFFHGRAIQGEQAPEIAWLDADGNEMSEEAWKSSHVRSLGVQLFGGCIDVDEHGEAITGDTLLLLFNADHEQTISFKLPSPGDGNPWELLIDTAHSAAYVKADTLQTIEEHLDLEPCSMAVLRSRVDTPEEIL
jgi:glycogen operon protein